MAGLIPTPEATRAANINVSPFNGGAPPPTPAPTNTAQPAQKPTAMPTATTPPATTASFPQTPSGTMKAPAVITSDAATEHFTSIQNALKQAQADIGQMRAYNTAKTTQVAPKENTPAPQPPTTGGEAPAPGGSAVDQEIENILNGLSGDDTTKKPDDQQTKIQQDDQSANDQDTASLSALNDTIDQLSTGTYPLSPAEQAQVDNVKVQYAGALKAAEDYKAAKALGATAAVAASGIEMYSPDEALGEIASAVKQGQQKVDTINSKIIDTQVKITNAIESNNYKAATALSKELNANIKARTDEISNINKTLAGQTDKLRTNALNVAKLQISTILSSDKLDITQKQNAVNQALKQGTLDEKTRHDVQTELNSQKKATASTTKPPAPAVQSTEKWINGTRGEDGYADPNAYKQAFDAWIGDGYQAKDFIKNYPPKAFINPANDWLPNYLASKTGTTASAADVATQIKKAFTPVGPSN